jgi:ankyrin repeat protein
MADSKGTTPLMAAMPGGHVGVVRELAARGADLAAAHPAIGGTAFHLACGLNQLECAAALVELGCDTAIRDKDGLTGKQVAEQHDHAAVLDVLRTAVVVRLRAGVAVDQPAVRAVHGVDALWDAGLAGDVAEMARLLDAGAELDALVAGRNPDGAIVSQGTALIGAANHGELDAVRLLLARGADPRMADSNGTIPLMAAMPGGHVGVVRELAARGADLDAAHPATGGTAFHFACVCNQPECAAALVELGCDTAIKTKDGRTPDGEADCGEGAPRGGARRAPRGGRGEAAGRCHNGPAAGGGGGGGSWGGRRDGGGALGRWQGGRRRGDGPAAGRRRRAGRPCRRASRRRGSR